MGFLSFQIYVFTLRSHGKARAEPAASSQRAPARPHLTQGAVGAGQEAQTLVVWAAEEPGRSWGGTKSNTHVHREKGFSWPKVGQLGHRKNMATID